MSTKMEPLSHPQKIYVVLSASQSTGATTDSAQPALPRVNIVGTIETKIYRPDALFCLGNLWKKALLRIGPQHDSVLLLSHCEVKTVGDLEPKEIIKKLSENPIPEFQAVQEIRPAIEAAGLLAELTELGDGPLYMNVPDETPKAAAASA